jgi:DNA primase
VLTNTKGGAVSWANWRQRLWYPALHRAGIADAPVASAKGAFDPYTLRHTCATVMLHASKPGGGHYLFPEERITKNDLFDYNHAVAPVLVPHLRNRPGHDEALALRSDRGGVFPKAGAQEMPSWIPTRTYRTHPREGESRLVDFPLVNSPEALLWMVQMNCIDMNAWYSRVDKADRPDFVLFDLDPPERGFVLAVRVAHLIRTVTCSSPCSRAARHSDVP